MSNANTVRRINKITKEQCQSWVENHTIDPTTGKTISAPDSVSQSSLNYMISSACLKHDIKREGNHAVYAIIDGKTAASTKAASSTRVIDSVTTASKASGKYDMIMSLLDPGSYDEKTLNQQPDLNAKKFIALFKLLNNKNIEYLNSYTGSITDDDEEWAIFKTDYLNKKSKYWCDIMISEKDYYINNNNKYYSFKNINEKLIEQFDQNLDVKVKSNSINKFTKHQLYFKTLFVMIILDRKELKHKFFRDDEVFVKFKKLVESVVKKFVPDRIKVVVNGRKYNVGLNNMFRFFQPESYYVAKDPNLENMLKRYNIYYRNDLDHTHLIDLDSIDHMSINDNSGYSSLQKSIQHKCVKNINDIQNDMFKTFKDRITKAYFKYNNVERFIDLNEFETYVNQRGYNIPLSDIASFIDKYEGNKNYENETDLNLLKLSKEFFKDDLNVKMSKLISLFANDMRYREYKDIIIDTETYLSSLFKTYYDYKKSSNINIFRIPRKNWKVTFQSNGIKHIGIDAGGLLNQLITEVSKELFSRRVFVKPKLSSGLKSDKYFLNPDFNVESLELFRDPEYQNLNKQSLKNEFYYFLGSFMNFVFLNGFTIPQRLSSYLLSGFIYNNFTSRYGETVINTKGEEFTYYMMRDFPDFYDYFIKLMKEYNGEQEYETWITDDTHLPLTKYYEDETSDNISDISVPIEGMHLYINNLARHIYLKNPLKDFTKDSKGRPMDMMSYHMSFFSAIPYDTRKIINIYRITFDDLDHILTPELDQKTIEKFVNNVFNNIDIYNNGSELIVSNSSYKIIEEQTRNIFKDASNKQKFLNKLLNDRDFYIKLLSFWSGKEVYEPNKKYKIIIKKTQGMLPNSSTCFYTMVITTYKDFDDFLQKLEMAVLNTYGKFEVAGGSKQKKKMR